MIHNKEEFNMNSKNNATFNRFVLINYLFSLINNNDEDEVKRNPLMCLIYGYDLCIDQELRIFFQIKDRGFKANIDDTQVAILAKGLDVSKNKVNYNKIINNKAVNCNILLAEYIALESDKFSQALTEFKNKKYDKQLEVNRHIERIKEEILLAILSSVNDIKIIQCLYQIGVINPEEVVSSKVLPIFKT